MVAPIARDMVLRTYVEAKACVVFSLQIGNSYVNNYNLKHLDGECLDFYTVENYIE